MGNWMKLTAKQTETGLNLSWGSGQNVWPSPLFWSLVRRTSPRFWERLGPLSWNGPRSWPPLSMWQLCTSFLWCLMWRQPPNSDTWSKGRRTSVLEAKRGLGGVQWGRPMAKDYGSASLNSSEHNTRPALDPRQSAWAFLRVCQMSQYVRSWSGKVSKCVIHTILQGSRVWGPGPSAKG